jgi:hypothetical protein
VLLKNNTFFMVDQNGSFCYNMTSEEIQAKYVT